VPIALVPRVGVFRARRRRSTRRDDDVGRRIGLAARNGLVDRLAIVRRPR